MVIDKNKNLTRNHCWYPSSSHDGNWSRDVTHIATPLVTQQECRLVRKASYGLPVEGEKITASAQPVTRFVPYRARLYITPFILSMCERIKLILLACKLDLPILKNLQFNTYPTKFIFFPLHERSLS